jgi:copper chaperone CopZ
VETLTLSITGMVCGGCSGNVQKALLALDGVDEAQVSHVDANAVVRYDASKVTPAQLTQAVIAAGYAVVV